MPRTYKSKNVQTKKELSGGNNLSEEYVESHKDTQNDSLMDNLVSLFDISANRKKKGTNWTPEELEGVIRNYFVFCSEKNMKPSKSSLILYIGCSKSQYHAWQTESSKYGVISELIQMANMIMETQYVQRGESTPTFNMFLLKAAHGMVETQKVEIVNNNVSKEEVADAISKLGLDEEDE